MSLRSEGYAEVRIVRGGRVVYEFAGRTNELFYLPLFYKPEVTANTDVVKFQRISKMYLSDDYNNHTVRIDINPDDIIIDETAMTMSVTKVGTATYKAWSNRVYLSGVADSQLLHFIRVRINDVLVNVGDVVYIRYVGKLYLTLSNPGGILSDAVMDYTELLRRLYYRFKGTTTQSLRIAKVEYVDDAGNVVLSVSTNNDTSNYVVRAPLTMVPGTVKVKTVRLCDSSGTALIRFTKPEPVVIPAGSAIKTEVTIQ